MSFRRGVPGGVRVVVRPDVRKQTIEGIGTSFTESSAYLSGSEQAGSEQATQGG